jgi:hypothetical protein
VHPGSFSDEPVLGLDTDPRVFNLSFRCSLFKSKGRISPNHQEGTMRNTRWGILLGLTICSHLAFGQNSMVSWSSLNMGFARAAAGNLVVKSVAGQPFTGRMEYANTVVESGFLEDTLVGAVMVGVDEGSIIPSTFALRQNYPNPFNPSTIIGYELPHASRVSLKIYNVLGQEVTTLVNEEKPAGVHEVRFNAAGHASGMYVYRLRAGDFVAVMKLLLLK